MSFIEVKSLIKKFGKSTNQVTALNNLTFTINKGEFVVFMGPSGAGKSTLVNVLAGLESPTQGQVTIETNDLGKMSDTEKCKMRRRIIGIVFQFFNLHPGLTVAENIELPMVIAGLPKKDRTAKISRALSQVQMQERATHFSHELSGGEQQRVAIARALVMEPALILADEPTGDLDSENGNKIIELLHDLNTKHAVTIIEVTHDEKMLRIGDRLIQMEDGMIKKDYIIKSPDQIPQYNFMANNH